MRIQAIFCSVQNIGRHVKKTKKHFLWKFVINGRDHILELFVSMISGKKKLKIDGRVVFEGQKVLSQSFSYPLEVDNQMLNIYQNGDKFELLINNQPFSHLYEDGRGHGYDDVRSNSYYGSVKASTSRNKFGRFNKNETLRVNEDDEYGSKRHGDYDSNGYGSRADDWNDVKYSPRHERPRNAYNDDEYSEGRDGPNRWEENRMDNSEYREYGRDDSDSFEKHQNKYSDGFRTNSRAKTTGAAINNFGEYNMQNTQRSQYDNNGFNGNMKTHRFDNKENAFQETTTITHTQVKNTFFDIDPVESALYTKTQQRVALETTAQQNMFVFGTTREEQNMQTQTQTQTQVAPIQLQQQQQWQQWEQPQPQAQPEPQVLSVVVQNNLLDLASESDTRANTLTELYKQGPSPLLQIEFPLQTQTQSQPQLQIQCQPAPVEVDLLQAQSQPTKKDLWQTNLVHLDSDDLRPAPLQKQAEPTFIHFNVPLPGTTGNNVNYNYVQPQPMQPMQNNMNMGNYGTMNGFGMRA